MLNIFADVPPLYLKQVQLKRKILNDKRIIVYWSMEFLADSSP